MTRAVLEGVTHAFRDSFDALTGTGTRIDRLIGVGGGTKSDYWVQAIATSLGLPVDLPVAGDFGGAFGAARLGLMAATGAGVEACGTPPIARTVEPVAEFQDDFSESYARYRAGYVALRDLS
jgi:xylulokinase